MELHIKKKKKEKKMYIFMKEPKWPELPISLYSRMHANKTQVKLEYQSQRDERIQENQSPHLGREEGRNVFIILHKFYFYADLVIYISLFLKNIH